MKTLQILILFFAPLFVTAQTKFFKTDQKLINKEFVYDVVYNGNSVGEFIPVRYIELVTRETDPSAFRGNLSDLHNNYQAVAVSPDGMTADFKLQGKCLSYGRECGDGIVYQYGIVVVEGSDIEFTHKDEIRDFDFFYDWHKMNQSTLFFLPVIYRTFQGQVFQLGGSTKMEKVLIRRETYDGVQIGMIVFKELTSYDDIKAIVLGLDHGGTKWAWTSHIYTLDGGGTYGQWTKEVSGQVQTKGTREQKAVTNYLVLR